MATYMNQVARGESIKPDDPRMSRNVVSTIATPQMGREAAAQVARDASYRVHILGDSVVTGPTLTNVNDFRALLIETETAPIK
jgi:glycerate-2-kinase